MATAILLRAITRLSPRMAAYQVKRLLRNRLAAWFPGAYAAHIRRIALSLPELTQPSDAAVAMAQDVAAFYHDEYLPVIEAAASGTFTFFGKTVAFGSVERIDWHHTIPAETDFHLWRMKLGHMGFACPMLMSGRVTGSRRIKPRPSQNSCARMQPLCWQTSNMTSGTTTSSATLRRYACISPARIRFLRLLSGALIGMFAKSWPTRSCPMGCRAKGRQCIRD